MMNFQDMIKIKAVSGVKEYIFIDNQGQIIVHDIQQAKKLAPIISRCINTALKIAKNTTYLSFSRLCGQDIYIFPVGNYTLGVVKQPHVSDIEFSGHVVEFLNHLAPRASAE